MKTQRNKIFLFVVLIIFSAGSIIYFNSKDSEKVFFDSSDSGYNLASYQKDSNNNSISSSRQTIITETVKNVSPAVVGINVTEIRQYRDPFSNLFDDPFFRQFFGNRGNYNQKVKGLGSGFIISPDGYILTNDHVAGNATEITITMTNGKHYNAKVVGTDPTSDICLLKVDGNDLPYVALGNSDDIMIGEWVIALGNPFGLFEINDKPTVTVGVISATGMNLEPLNNRYYLNMLQTDAAINGGNSGGPLVNSIGEVIGMNTLIYTAGGSEGNIGLSFAIPINKIKRIVTELKQKGSIDRDFDIGLRIQSIDEGIADYYNLPASRGVIITYIASGSPASKAGLNVGDIILEVDNFKINNEKTLISVFQEFRVGQTITLKIIRDNKEMDKKMTLEKR
ncbi:MAG: 2-alkenal reductase [Ignavibacteria bacterium GWA2_35_9]|nr:MAG: 2-alkenal reductase [Ignavibacteria bacterium GWA2_35_9]OGU43132.1 MAG: 2-alkenal reductase [Ignavibacteria bacterium GWB2_36_8]OGU51076.1 MAG: 2-alkenal reductase [Ignavibacteria bacterium GWC2_36_12]